MISFLLLHFNRPYLLDINIKLLRKYAPSDIQIVVADDGSRPEVISKLKAMQIDKLFVQKQNKNTWREGTCSDTIASGRKLCSGEYLVFSEDDFFFTRCPVANASTEQGKLMPDISFEPVPEWNVFDEAVGLLKSNPTVKNVQIARDIDKLNKGVPTAEKVLTKNVVWRRVDRLHKPKFYYCNWPNMSRTAEMRSVPIIRGKAIWSFESKFSNDVNDVFGNSNWAVVPERRHYVHVGTAFSQRLDEFAAYNKGVEKRNKVHRDLQQAMFSRVFQTSLENFNAWLLEQHLQGKFHIDFNEMIENGLEYGFVSAFGRLAKLIGEK